MNVELIKINPSDARAKLASYRKAIAARAHTKASEEVRAVWEQIEAGYKAAAKGLPLVELSKAMQLGGWDELGRPRFAVARADRKRVRCWVYSDVLRFHDPGTSEYRPNSMRFEFRDRAFLDARPRINGPIRAEGIVPMVPPDVLPRLDLDLSRRVILWEADWRQAPGDPLLLLPIGGDLYAVEAAWDLTALERAVISVRA